MMTKFSTLLLFVCLLLPILASAQEPLKKDFELSEDRTFDLPPPNQIPRQHINEMNTVYQDCMVDRFDSSHRDCKCYAMAYLEARLRTPSIPRRMVETAVKKVCYNSENMVGYYYNQCLNNMRPDMVKSKRNPVELCKCYGESVARYVPSLNRLTFKTLQKLQSNAYSECGFFR